MVDGPWGLGSHKPQHMGVGGGLGSLLPSLPSLLPKGVFWDPQNSLFGGVTLKERLVTTLFSFEPLWLLSQIPTRWSQSPLYFYAF